jgi:TolB protein
MGSMPVWSPDGRQLAFYETRFRAVAVFDFTSSLRMILAEAGFPPSWSPDGAFLAVGNRTGPALGRGMVQIANVAEGDATRRPLAEGAGSDQAPAWSPTGEWIAFTRLGGDGNGVWVARPDGSEAHPLHEAANGAYWPLAWQPDGGAVAFTRLQGRPGAPEPDREVWVAPLSGTPRRLGVRGAVLAWVP